MGNGKWIWIQPSTKLRELHRIHRWDLRNPVKMGMGLGFRGGECGGTRFTWENVLPYHQLNGRYGLMHVPISIFNL
ncbi:hypothetical protein GOBAR_DD08611 [Gossypium barbadense]|nr:hypothetical protein GOBAR_DD08611 [Gossypium barbadense]